MLIRKGKLGESRGRKAMGLRSSTDGYDCQAAEENHSYYSFFVAGLGLRVRFFFDHMTLFLALKVLPGV